MMALGAKLNKVHQPRTTMEGNLQATILTTLAVISSFTTSLGIITCSPWTLVALGTFLEEVELEEAITYNRNSSDSSKEPTNSSKLVICRF